ncbi:MAG: sulfite exporter TauE/SafE family protein [Bacteroidota bacterium]
MLFTYFIALIGAFLAGCVNTLAGNGSAITLTILMEVIGLPPDVANGTNRLGVLTQGMAGTWAFQRAGKLKDAWNWPVIIWTSVGAIIGMVLSIIISPEGYRQVFRYLLFFMLIVILVKPKRWLVASKGERPNISNWVLGPLFFLLGIYGGFIQMGMGIFFLATTVLVARYDIIAANVLKGLVVTIYTIFAVAFFAWKGLIAWEIGAIMATGQMFGGYLTATYASRYPSAGIWAYRLLIVVVIGAIVRAFVL